MKRIIVLGGNGQLGKCLASVVNKNQNENLTFHFFSSTEANITNYSQIEGLFNQLKPTFIVNAAAYTKVDLAENEKDKAFLVNACAVEKLAKLCHKFSTKLIHISTDYVFDGTKSEPYEETDPVNPINTYGASKQEGEHQIRLHHDAHFIVRTSWLYSDIGHNFYNSMLKLFEEKESLNITTDQVGCPTNAYHLAALIYRIIQTDKTCFGTYHFCNSGATTWYEFATQILEGSRFSCEINAVDHYATPAKRPANSVLNTTKTADTFGITIASWKEALAELQTNGDLT